MKRTWSQLRLKILFTGKKRGSQYSSGLEALREPFNFERPRNPMSEASGGLGRLRNPMSGLGRPRKASNPAG